MSGRLIEQVMVPMRDGTRLATDVYLPDDSGGPWPAILRRTPYGLGPDSSHHEAAQALASHSFAVINQDVRGRYRSEGRFRIEGEGEDGYDTIAWMRAQSWCSGKIGMRGASYMALTQFAAAQQHPPGLTCLFAGVGGRYWRQLHQWGLGNALPQLESQWWPLSVVVDDPHLRQDEATVLQLQAALTEFPDLQAWRDDPRGNAYPLLDSVLDVPRWADVWPLPGVAGAQAGTRLFRLLDSRLRRSRAATSPSPR